MADEEIPAETQPKPTKEKRAYNKAEKEDPLANIDQDLVAQVKISQIMRGLRHGADRAVIAWFAQRYGLIFHEDKE